MLGLRFTKQDWRNAYQNGETNYLLQIRPDERLPQGVLRYLKLGEEKGIPSAFKCRTRTPWFSVPHVYLPDGFLTYMSGLAPQLVSNDAQVVATNSLHILRLHSASRLTADEIALLWQTSLTKLSVEIEGHALGGGMLKLEPSEAESVMLPIPRSIRRSHENLAREIDALIRGGRDAAANELADREILMDSLGLSAADCSTLRSAAKVLRERRYSR